MGETSKLWKCLAGLLLPAAALLVFWPVIHQGFINYDDPDYVSQNPIVEGGLTWNGIQWAFGTIHGGNWHPLTWLSYMLDWQLYGSRPGLHHLTSLLFHAVNSLLVLLVLHRMTGAFWRSLLAAFLFALHPLHVESVAWISERKDVLSTFFFLLTLWAYSRYTKAQGKSAADDLKSRQSVFEVRGSSFNYFLTLLFFALGLMAKPMLVTLPFVLLLLDYWPLGRFKLVTRRASLIKEKIPFFALAIVTCLVTIHAQASAHSIVALKQSGLGSRVASSLVAYSDYLGKTIWPAGLSVFYPYLGIPAVAKIIPAILILLAGSVLAWRSVRIRPYWLIGWLWFLGTLFPVIGIVQIGQAAMADRYSYIPLIGLFFAVAWGLGDLVKQRQIVGAAAIAGVVACAVVARVQVNYWRDDETLFRHADAVTARNFMAKTEIGLALVARGKMQEAEQNYRAALQFNPEFSQAYYCLAALLLGQGKTDEAIANYRRAIAVAPYYFEPHKSLGVIYAIQGHYLEAEEQLRAAQSLSLGDFDVSLNLGNCLLTTGNPAAAIPQFQEALRLKPDSVEALNRLAWLYATSADPKNRNGTEAVRLARRADELTGSRDVRTQLSLAASLAEAGQYGEAVTTVEKAAALAQSSGQTGLISVLNHLLELFRAGKPFHEGTK